VVDEVELGNVKSAGRVLKVGESPSWM
jgi:hypothetical protein